MRFRLRKITRHDTIESVMEEGAKLEIPKFLGEYQVGKNIARGATGVVVEATRDGRLVAIKVMSQSDAVKRGQEHFLKRECEICRKLCSEWDSNIVRFDDVFQVDDLVCIVMERLPGPNFAEWLMENKPTETDLKRFFRQIASAVCFCHKTLRIAVGDLQLINVVVDEYGNAKLIDFGYCHADCPCSEPFVGNPCCAAPEHLAYSYRNEPYDPFAGDIWTLGMLFGVMATKVEPFGYTNDLYARVTRGDIPWQEMPSDIRSLVDDMTKVSPTDRLSIEKVLERCAEWGDDTAVVSLPEMDVESGA